MKLRVVEGRKSPLYNHFEEYELASCRATKTRLMGVIALKLTWQDACDARRRYYQIVHLDYSEYGIDEYLEFECIPGESDYEDLRAEVQERWNRFINIMGDRAVSVTPACMLRLLESALALAGDEKNRQYDTEENKRFRHFALQRLDMMKSVLNARGVTPDSCTLPEAINMTSSSDIGHYGTINYFLMRLLDRDFDAAIYLSDIPRDELESSPLASCGVQTLIRCDITRAAAKDNPYASERLRMYNCTLTSLSGSGYYHTVLSIWLGSGRKCRVMRLEAGSSILLSDFEAAIQVAEPEYITVIDFNSESAPDFNPSYLGLLSRSDAAPCENGILYTIYNESNSHVDSSEYRIGNDVHAHMLVSMRGELVLMGRNVTGINRLENSVMLSAYAPFISVKGRYLLDNPIFHALCHTPGLSFDDMTEPDE